MLDLDNAGPEKWRTRLQGWKIQDQLLGSKDAWHCSQQIFVVELFLNKHYVITYCEVMFHLDLPNDILKKRLHKFETV